ncbi:hypothetical protein BAUCODRAFT_22266 [Baudoinia panamericana UAMH 10762]|uniref:Uncharacterized protein n=1 Tax=Baudoinia panamericana (strain UAMH 10762) TaxID=717646 RepID=M2NIN2_BAUPA|nr:uncharacterized protein BAUCODRAFT_22266 [Baudoinia panamericana UAMH 10762]EMC98955.1 hypothetical protein BAUCODRAFT_22266 [Baudoinia panamericana UAMH 10762]
MSFAPSVREHGSGSSQDIHHGIEMHQFDPAESPADRLLQHASGTNERSNAPASGTVSVGATPPGLRKSTTNVNTRGVEHARDPVPMSLWRAVTAWVAQIASWVLGLCFYIAIIVVLRRFDKQSVPSWPYDIQLSAIINLLGTFGDVFLIAPVGSVLGQTRWIRSRTWRPLEEICALDAASRGAKGSVELLFSGGAGTLASYGAIITVLALVSGTFVQQTVKTPTFYPCEATARIPIARTLNSTGLYQLPDEPDLSSWGLDASMMAAAYTGIYSPTNATFGVAGACPSGNCSWPPFQTLAVCNTCANLTSQLKRSTETMTYGLPGNYEKKSTYVYSLPSGFELSGDYQIPTLDDKDLELWRPTLNVTLTRGPAQFMLPQVYYTLNKSAEAFTNNGSVLLGVVAIGLTPDGLPAQPNGSISFLQNGWTNAKPVAHECLLQYCVRNITANFNGTWNEIVESTYTDQSATGIGTDGYEITLPASMQHEKPAVNYTVTQMSSSALSSWLAGFLAIGNGSVTRSSSGATNGQATPYYSTTQMSVLANAMNSSYNGFPDVMDNLAASLTQALRQLPYQPSQAIGQACYAEVSVGHACVRDMGHVEKWSNAVERRSTTGAVTRL